VAQDEELVLKRNFALFWRTSTFQGQLLSKAMTFLAIGEELTPLVSDLPDAVL
jgi:hypothetical protein